MKTLFLIITIDTEESYSDVPRMIECDFGEQGNCGVNYIMKALEQRGMRGCFFCAVHGHQKYKGEYEGYMEKLLQRISRQGHEIGLHTHPYSGNGSTFPMAIHKLDFESQKKILREGMEFIHGATGQFPIVHRGGAYSCNDETFRALGELGFQADSSVFYGNESALNGFASYFTVNQAKVHRGILEIPVLNFLSEGGEFRKLDVNNMSEKEFVAVLDAMKERQDFPVAQMMLHSFSFLDQEWGKDRAGKKPLYVAGSHHVYGINRGLMDRFEHILDHLAKDTRVQVLTFSEYLALRRPAPSFWGDGIFAANSEEARKVAWNFKAVRTNTKAAVKEAYHLNDRGAELDFDALPDWGRRTYYGDADIVRIAEEIMSGTMHAYPRIEGLSYKLETFDWGVQHSKIPNTFQLYLQALNPVIVLARAYEMRRDRAFLQFGVLLIKSWQHYRLHTSQSRNRYLFNDHSVALRANNLMYFGRVCHEHAFWDESLDGLLAGIIQECGIWLMDDRHYTRNHNHGIMQDEALLHIGRLLRRNDYMQHAKERLREQWANAFNVEGVHQENSPEYHAIVSRLFLGIAIFLTQSGDNDGTELRKKLALTTEYSNWILLPNGFKAQLGDTNSRPGQRYAEKPLQARKTSKNSIFYPDAGIYFYRSRLDQEPKNDTWKMLKCGYHKLTHKHADDGSFMLYSKGYEIFTDGGIYGYTNDAFRKYFTSSLSHNSVVVDGESYDISEENAAKVGISMLQSGNIDHVRASNNAYKGVSWIRDLASIDDLTVLQDRLSSEEMHEYAQVFHLAEDISVLQAGDDEVVLGVADTGYRVRLRQYGATKQLEIVTGDLQRPGYGLLSRGENHVAVSTDLIFRVKAANTNFTTVIAIEDAEGLVRIYEKKEFVDKLQYDPVKNTFQLSL